MKGIGDRECQYVTHSPFLSGVGERAATATLAPSLPTDPLRSTVGRAFIEWRRLHIVKCVCKRVEIRKRELERGRGGRKEEKEGNKKRREETEGGEERREKENEG